MKITFFSNFLMHHQTPFCDEMYKILGVNFTFVATEKISQERLDLGYDDLSDAYPYCLNSYKNEEEKQKAYNLSIDSDIVILGNNPNLYLRDRLLKGKIVLRYSERLFKKGRWRILDPRLAKALYKSEFRYRNNKNLLMLCASAYTAEDCRFIFSYPGRTFKWGYFTSIKEQNIGELIKLKPDECIKILWAGRFIDWKHPEMAVKITKRLIENGINVKLDFIGSGEMENSMRNMVEDYKLEDNISFLGSMSPEDVRCNMEKANIFLFTSDRQEGWGAVLNESMASGCAVVANKYTGSAPFLISNGENGYLYDGTERDLYKKVLELIKSKNKREKFAKNAYFTMKNEWNPKIAAERLTEFCNELLKGNIIEYKQGPLSRT